VVRVIDNRVIVRAIDNRVIVRVRDNGVIRREGRRYNNIKEVRR